MSVSIGACGDGDDGTSSPTAPSAPTTATTIEVAEGLRPFPTDIAPLPAPGEDPADGEHAVEISSVGDGTITVDFIEFLTGDAAAEAAGEEGVPNDYFVRNTDEDDVSIDVADDVEVTIVAIDTEGPVSNESASFDDVNADDSPSPYWWIVIDDGTVVEINQQYIP